MPIRAGPSTPPTGMLGNRAEVESHALTSNSALSFSACCLIVASSLLALSRFMHASLASSMMAVLDPIKNHEAVM